MNGIIDADTHISEGEAMWKMMGADFLPRRPIMLKVPQDTWYGNRDAFWLIDGEIFPKPAGKGSFALVTPSDQSVQIGRKDSTMATREMIDNDRSARRYGQVMGFRPNTPVLQHSGVRVSHEETDLFFAGYFLCRSWIDLRCSSFCRRRAAKSQNRLRQPQ